MDRGQQFNYYMAQLRLLRAQYLECCKSKPVPPDLYSYVKSEFERQYYKDYADSLTIFRGRTSDIAAKFVEVVDRLDECLGVIN